MIWDRGSWGSQGGPEGRKDWGVWEVPEIGLNFRLCTLPQNFQRQWRLLWPHSGIKIMFKWFGRSGRSRRSRRSRRSGSSEILNNAFYMYLGPRYLVHTCLCKYEFDMNCDNCSMAEAGSRDNFWRIAVVALLLECWPVIDNIKVIIIFFLSD